MPRDEFRALFLGGCRGQCAPDGGHGFRSPAGGLGRAVFGESAGDRLARALADTGDRHRATHGIALGQVTLEVYDFPVLDGIEDLVNRLLCALDAGDVFCVCGGMRQQFEATGIFLGERQIRHHRASCCACVGVHEEVRINGRVANLS